MAEENVKSPGFFQSLKNLLGSAGQEIANDNSSGGKLGSVIRSVSDSRGAEPLWAAFRQGADELGQALKPFQDSLQAHPEPGGVLEPHYGDLVAARSLPSPGDIARGTNYTAAEQGQSYMRGLDDGNVQAAQQQRVNDQSRGR